MYGEAAVIKHQKYIDEMESKVPKVIDEDIVDKQAVMQFQYLMENEYHPWNDERARFPFRIPSPMLDEEQFRAENSFLLKTSS